MHRSITLTVLIVCAVAAASLGPARAQDAAGNDAGRTALPGDAATTGMFDPGIDDFRRWFQQLRPQSATQALVVQPLLGGTLTSEFGMRRHPLLGTWEGHDGVDWAAPRGTTVFAAADGTVSFAGWDSGYGNTVRITHSDGVETVYAHLSRIEAGVQPGAAVVQGYVVGEVGSTGMTTGPNLHFEVRVDGTPVDPLGAGTTLRVATIDRPVLARLRAD